MTYAIDSLEISPVSYFEIASTSAALHPEAFLELSAPQSSSRAGLRRMRTETPTTTCDPGFVIEPDFEPVELLLLQLDEALRKGRYEEGFSLIDQLDVLWNDTLLDPTVEFLASLQSDTQSPSPHLRSALEFLGQGALSEMRAYFLALTNDDGAIDLCNSGFEKLWRGVSEVRIVAKEQSQRDEETFATVEKILKMAQYLTRGIFAISLNMRELAIDDLKAGYNMSLTEEFFDEEDFDIECFFPIKVLEQKLQAPLLPKPSIVNDRIPKSLFLAGRYEEALALLSMPQSFEDEEDSIDGDGAKAACLALLGRYDEAIDLLENRQDGVAEPAIASLVYLLKGDLEKAKEAVLNDENELAYLLLPVILGCERSAELRMLG